MSRFREINGMMQEWGTYEWPNFNFLVATRDRTFGDYRSCEDIVGNRTGANPLQIVHKILHHPSMDGTLMSGSPPVAVKKFTAFPTGLAPSVPDPRAQWPAYNSVDLQTLAWEIAQKTNPSLPHVSLPTFFGELKDLPDLLRNRGLGLLQKVSSGYLSWRWVAAPMIRDLRNLLSFSNACRKRFMELQKLNSGKPLRKRVTLSKDRIDGPKEYITMHSEGVVFSGWRQNSYTSEVWGSCEYVVPPGGSLPGNDFAKPDGLLDRLNAGITSHEALATLWELTPWSWFADWFFRIGDFIAATNNTLGLRWGRICVMRTSIGRTTYEIDRSTYPDWVTLNGTWHSYFERKERHPTFPIIPLPFLSLPILNSGQLSILAALASLKL
jgi:hypothetical protein